MNRRLAAPVGITATGQCFPSRVVTNDDLSKIMETNDEWIRTRTGISERRWAEPGTGASQLGAPALQMALDNRGMKATELDAIIVATVTPDTLFPATACRIQEMVGATNAFGFDLSAACSGFLYALTTAASLVAAGGVKRVGVVGVDIMSVERVEEGLGILDFDHTIDGSGGCFLYMPAGGSASPATAETVAARDHYIHQSGSEVFKKAVREMADNSRMLMDRNGFAADELKLFVPHQANIRIMDAAAKRLELDPARMMVNIDKFGNTTAATIPTALHQAFEQGRMAKGDLVALAAFGAGFTWGSTLLRWAY